MLISIFWHFHPPYVFFNLFLRHQEWNVALPSRAVVAEKKLSVERLLNENLKTCRKSADKQDSPTFTPRRQARTTPRPPEQFVHPADKRGQDLSLSESPDVNPADIRGQEATPPKIPRTSADIPRTTANAMFSLTTDHAEPETCEFQQICSPPKPNLLHHGGPRQILSGQPRYISNSSPKSYQTQNLLRKLGHKDFL